MLNKLIGRSIESVVQSVESDQTRRTDKSGSSSTQGVQESGSRKASRETRVQSLAGRGSWSSVFDSWQVCGGMKVGVCLLPLMERANQ